MFIGHVQLIVCCRVPEEKQLHLCFKRKAMLAPPLLPMKGEGSGCPKSICLNCHFAGLWPGLAGLQDGVIYPAPLSSFPQPHFFSFCCSAMAGGCGEVCGTWAALGDGAECHSAAVQLDSLTLQSAHTYQAYCCEWPVLSPRAAVLARTHRASEGTGIV